MFAQHIVHHGFRDIHLLTHFSHWLSWAPNENPSCGFHFDYGPGLFPAVTCFELFCSLQCAFTRRADFTIWVYCSELPFKTCNWSCFCHPTHTHTHAHAHFRGTCLHLQSWRVSQARNQHEAGSKLYWFLAWLTPRPWSWRWNVPLKWWLYPRR
jgi:hypothetical protein